MRVSDFNEVFGAGFVCVLGTAGCIAFSTDLTVNLVTGLDTGLAGVFATSFGADLTFCLATAFGAGFAFATILGAGFALTLPATTFAFLPSLLAFGFAFAVTNVISPETTELMLCVRSRKHRNENDKNA